MAILEIKFVGSDETRAAVNEVAGGLRGVGDAADDAKSRGSGFFSNLLSTAGGFLAANVIGGIAGQFGNLVSGMIGGNAEFEKYQTQFGVLLGSADAAKQRLDELAKFGASTPFELPEVVKADKILQGFGLHSEESAQKFGFSGEQIRTIAGDVASGTGSSFEEMSLLLGKFSAGATGEAIARMAELGIASKADLAAMGLEFSKSGELLSPLPESMNVVLKLMQDKFGGMMEAQSSTFEGMMSNLQDWVAGTLRTIGAPIFEVLKEKLGGLLEFLNDPGTQAALVAFAEALANGVGVAMDFLSTQAIPALIDAWTLIQPAVAVISGILSGELGPSLDQTASTFVAVQGTISAVMEAIGAVVSAVLAQVSAFWQSHGAEIMAFVQSTWAQINEIIQLAMQLINATIVPILQGIAAFINSHGAEIQAILTNTWNAIKALIDAALTIIKGVLTAALQIIQGDWSGAWETIKATFSRVWDDIKIVLSSALDNAKQVLSMAWDAIKDKVETAWDDIKSAISGVLDDLADAILGLPDKVAGAGEAVVQMVWDGIAAEWDKLVSWFNGKLQELRDKLPFSEPRDSSSPLYGLGKSGAAIITQILSGMEETIPDLLMLVTGMGDDLLSEVEKIAEKISDTIADSFDATADINRLMARNIDALGDISDAYRDATKEQLDAAAAEAAQIADPEQAAKYYKERSAQILEMAKLLDEREKARQEGDIEAVARYDQQIGLIQKAQEAERQAYEERQKHAKTGPQNIADQIGALLDSIDLQETPEAAGLYTMLVEMLKQLGMGSGGSGGSGPVYLPPPPPMGAGPAQANTQTLTFQIDARGSTMSERQFEDVVRRVLAQAGTQADSFMRTRR